MEHLQQYVPLETEVVHADTFHHYVIGYEKRDHIAQKHNFLPFFKLSPFQSLNSPRLLAWFVSSMGLLLHRSNVRSLSKPPVQSSEPPKQGIKRRFSNAIDARDRPAHTGNGRGSRFAARVVG